MGRKGIKLQGYSWERKSSTGVSRWTAMYLIQSNGKYMSAGTWGTKEEADAAWQDTLATMRRGLYSDPRKGRMSFGDFCDHFLNLMTHQKVNTRKNYRTQIKSQFRPAFGDVLLYELNAEMVMRWITSMGAAGLSANTIRSYKANLSGMLGTAVALGWIPFNPALGVKVPKSKPRRIKIADGPDIAALINALPGPVSKILMHLEISTGCRWGEITELRVRDVYDHPDEPDNCYLWLQRAVVDAGPDHPDAIPGVPGPRYFVEDSTKGGKDRKVPLSLPVARGVKAHIAKWGLGSDDLLFPDSMIQEEFQGAQGPIPLEAVPDNLGMTLENKQGRIYKHGTLSGYNAGGCKCGWCRRAFAEYRAKRRAQGQSDRGIVNKSGYIYSVNTSDHLSDDWFRNRIYYPAAKAAGISHRITFHDLRHTHATWLAQDPSIPLTDVQERLGHASIETTMRYVHDVEVKSSQAGDIIDAMLSGQAKNGRRHLKAL